VHLIVRPHESVQALPQPAGFTLVEEDDVAFTLSLCREVYRIYGGYQEGAFVASDPLHAGLVMTMEMLAGLSRIVTVGMPAMRVTVAAAQTREMLAVMFDDDPMENPLAFESRDRYRAMLAGMSLAEIPVAEEPHFPMTELDPGPPRKSRLSRLFRRRRGLRAPEEYSRPVGR
jgi:hypothetical protein